MIHKHALILMLPTNQSQPFNSNQSQLLDPIKQTLASDKDQGTPKCSVHIGLILSDADFFRVEVGLQPLSIASDLSWHLPRASVQSFSTGIGALRLPIFGHRGRWTVRECLLVLKLTLAILKVVVCLFCELVLRKGFALTSMDGLTAFLISGAEGARKKKCCCRLHWAGGAMNQECMSLGA